MRLSETAAAKHKESKTIDHLAGMAEGDKTVIRTLYSNIFSHRRWSLFKWRRDQPTCAKALLEVAEKSEYQSLFLPMKP